MYRIEQKQVYSCEYAKQSLFLYYYLLVIVLFSKQKTVNLLLFSPVYYCLSSKQYLHGHNDMNNVEFSILDPIDRGHGTVHDGYWIYIHPEI